MSWQPSMALLANTNDTSIYDFSTHNNNDNNNLSSFWEKACAGLNMSVLAAANLTEEDCLGPPPPHLGGGGGGGGGGQLPWILMTIIQIFYALVCVVGLCGNTLVIYVVLR